jgi:xanthine dehydrogenase iron-sulfur cluster and FAD-binding subunit A
MKPPKFDYHAPASIDEAVALLARYGGEAKVLAGGQSLMPMLNFRLARPAALVDVNRIAALAYIREENGTVAFGAMTRQRTIEFSPVVAARLPLLREATRWVGHLPIRSRGTIGGSIAHADPSAEYPAVLTALGGEVVVQGPRGRRTVKAADLFETYLTTTLAAEELVVEVRLPAMPVGAGYAFEEFARRHGDFAIVGIAAMVVGRAGERCALARLASAGAGPVPVRLRAAEEILERDGLGEAAVAAARRRRARLRRVPAAPHARAHGARAPAGPHGGARMSDVAVRLTVNGQTREGRCATRKLLVDFLREDLGLTGTHVGCEHGICGACTVLLGGEAARSCLMLAVQADGAEIVTIEGLMQDGVLHPLQEAFREHHGLQCGFCTPGMLMTALDLLRVKPEPTEADVREGLSAVLCRCTGYHGIVKAVQAAAPRLRAGHIKDGRSA